jgi:uncharacterized protein (UPF0333 family)
MQKNLGISLIILGTLSLIFYSMYTLFKTNDIPLFIKLAILIILLGIVILIPVLIKESKKDKVVIK